MKLLNMIFECKYTSLALCISGYLISILCASIFFQKNLTVIERLFWVVCWYYTATKSGELRLEYKKHKMNL